MKNYLIVGAGEAGKLLATNFLSEKIEMNIVGFLDDSSAIGSQVFKKLEVLGKTNDLKKIVKKYQVNKVIIAVPSEKGKFVRKILLLMAELPDIELFILPRISEVVFNSRVSYSDLRHVDFVDLVGEVIIKEDQEKVEKSFINKEIVISGGGGSIGSELVNQIFLLKPKKLIIIDFCEKNLATINLKINQMIDLNSQTKLEFVLGNINNQFLLKRIFTENNIDIVFHAAAYKHVPVVEKNIYSGVANNVVSTFNLGKISGEHKVKNFVLVSTDKAVRPSNVMGQTKRIAEKIINTFNNQFNDTSFSIVRFGNVFNSSGSAVEIFVDQLRRGNELTITDPFMTRYFMTIPEAVHLIMQSLLMEDKENLFMLEMGDPINILELAKCIAIIGNNKLSEVTFKIIGAREGEKISEILFDNENEIRKSTRHSRIYSIQTKADSQHDSFEKELLKLFNLLDLETVMNHSNIGKDKLIKSLNILVM